MVQKAFLLHQFIDARGLVDVPLPLGLRDDVDDAEDRHGKERAAGHELRHLPVEFRRQERQVLRFRRRRQHAGDRHDRGTLEISGEVVIHPDMVPKPFQLRRCDGAFPLQKDGGTDRVEHPLFPSVGIPQRFHIVDKIGREIGIPFDHERHPAFSSHKSPPTIARFLPNRYINSNNIKTLSFVDRP